MNSRRDKRIRRFRRLLLSVLLLAIFLLPFGMRPTLAGQIPAPTAQFYVNDCAQLLSEESEDYIVKKNEQLYEQTGAQIVVVTVENMGGDSVEDYANSLFRQYGIGSKDKNNGVLLLLALEERDCRIEVGYGLEGAINDGKAGRILDRYIIPYLSEGEWDQGLVNGFDAILDEVCMEYDIEIERNLPESYRSPSGGGTSTGGGSHLYLPFWIMFVVCLIAGAIIGYLFEENALWPILIWLVVESAISIVVMTTGMAVLAIVVMPFATLIGYAATLPDDGSSSGGSGGYSSSSRSSHSSTSSRNYGGGGSSGGGGTSRKF